VRHDRLGVIHETLTWQTSSATWLVFFPHAAPWPDCLTQPSRRRRHRWV